MEKNAKIYIAGHRGMVGSAILRRLQKSGYTHFLLRTSKELDLTIQADVARFFADEKPDYVFIAAAYVGGIMANSDFPADFYYINSMIQNNVIHSAYKNVVKKLLFLESSCIYPRLCEQPIKEEYLLSGYLEPTNEAYALAKISGLKMCQYYNQQYGTNFISCMPTNLYGENDNFDLQTSHVLPALIRKFHDAKVAGTSLVELWGTGTPLREFMHVDDMADACEFLMDNYDGNEHINVGSGQEVSIAALADMVKRAVDFRGEVVYDITKPDGTPRKLLDSSRLSDMGWKPEISLEIGVQQLYEWYCTNVIVK